MRIKNIPQKQIKAKIEIWRIFGGIFLGTRITHAPMSDISIVHYHRIKYNKNNWYTITVNWYTIKVLQYQLCLV